MTALTLATDPRVATSLVHGLRLLEAFIRTDAAARSNRALAEETGLSKATVSRLTYTLAARGLVVADPASGHYRLGSTALALGYPLLVELGVRWLARLPMKQFADEVGGTVSLAIRDRDRLVVVETSRGSGAVSSNLELGATSPLVDTATGRAWLAAAVTKHAQAWRAPAAKGRSELRQHGYCASSRQQRAGVLTVAVPLGVLFDGEPMALSCELPATALGRDALRQTAGTGLQLLAKSIEDEWQHAVPHKQPRAAGRVTRYAEPFADAAGAHDPDDRQFAHTLARGVDLLLCMQAGDEAGVGNRELSRRLQLLPSTVARLTHTLCLHGYLRRDPSSFRYRLGPAALTLAHPMVSGLTLRRLARPAMTALAQQVGGAVSLGLRHQTDMVYVETAWRTDERLLPPDIGAPMPMLASAMGRAWLVRAPHDEQNAVLNRLRLSDADNVMRYADALKRAGAEIEQTGCCWSRDARPAIQAVAVPFARPIGGISFVMNCGVFAPQPLAAARARTIGRALVELVRCLEQTVWYKAAPN